MPNKTIYLKKLSQSKVTLFLEDYTNVVMPGKWFIMTEKTPRIAVPSGYALSIFADSTLETMLKRNLFTVENMNDLIEMAQEIGLLHREEKEIKKLSEPKRTNELLMSILKGGNKVKIQELFNSEDRERALQLAISNSKQLPLEVVEIIEDIVKVAIVQD